MDSVPRAGLSVSAWTAHCERRDPTRCTAADLLHTDDPALAALALPEFATRVGIQLGETLAALHAHGRAHGRVDPEHVLIDAHGRVRLSGVQHTAEARRRTPSPEQDLVGVSRVVSAVLSLGQTTSWAALGPGQGRLDATTVGLTAVLARAARPGGYVHAAELASELRRIAEGLPVAARRPTPWHLARAWLVANRRTAAAFALASLVGVTTLGDDDPTVAAREHAPAPLAHLVTGPTGRVSIAGPVRTSGALAALPPPAPLEPSDVARPPEHEAPPTRGSERAAAERAYARGDVAGLRRAAVRLGVLDDPTARLLMRLADVIEFDGAAAPSTWPAPEDVWEATLLARLRRLSGDPFGALEAAEDGLRVWEDDIGLRAESIWARASIGAVESALEDLEHLDAAAEPSLGALLAEAALLAEVGRTDEAQRRLDVAATLAPDAFAVEQVRARIQGGDALERMVERLRDHAASCPSAAIQCIDATFVDPDGRAEALAGLRDRFPRSLAPVLARARALRRAGDLAPALELLDSARADTRLASSALYAELAAVALAAARVDVAAEALAEWSERYPSDPRPAALLERARPPSAATVGPVPGADGDAPTLAALAGYAQAAIGREDLAGYDAALQQAERWGLGGAELWAPLGFWPDTAVHDPTRASRLMPLFTDLERGPARDLILAARLMRDRGDPDGARALLLSRRGRGGIGPTESIALRREIARFDAELDAALPWSAGALVRVTPEPGSDVDLAAYLCPLGSETRRAKAPRWPAVSLGADGVVVEIDLGWSTPVSRVDVELELLDLREAAVTWRGDVDVSVGDAPDATTPVWAAHTTLSDSGGLRWDADVPVTGRYVRLRVRPEDPSTTLALGAIEAR